MGPKKEKRGKEMGFDRIGKEKTEKRIKNWMENTPAAHWRKWTQIKIKYTYTVRTWSLGDKLPVDKMICPWGMHNFLGNLMS